VRGGLESDARLDHVGVTQHAVLSKTDEIFVLFRYLKHSPSLPLVLLAWGVSLLC